MLLRIFIIILFFNLFKCFSLPKYKSNTCENFSDYGNIFNSKNCWYNPDVGSSPCAIANRYGYNFESYKTVTEDGYILGIFRIPPKNPQNFKPIFFQHGILETSMCWLSLGKNSLAFKLSDDGYDVWLGNFRGTIYSNQHVKLSNISDDHYWDFSFDELGRYDLHAMLELVNNITNKKIIYVGHSLGSTTSYVYAISRKEDAESKLAALISLAPVAYFKHTGINFKQLSILSSEIYKISTFINIFALGVSTTEGKTIFYRLCLYGPTHAICKSIAKQFFKYISCTIAPDMLPVVLTQAPAATCLKVLRHFAQEVMNDGQFQAYDYGSLNLEKYKSVKPPIYDVAQIRIPVYLLYGKNDKVAAEEDVKNLYMNLKTKKFLFSIAENGEIEFDHTDFIFNKNSDYLYTTLIKIIKSVDDVH